MKIGELPVDFTDDVINKEINEKRRYKIIQHGDGTVSFEDVTDYLQMGSLFGAKDVIDTNRKINEIMNKTKFYGIRKWNLAGMKLLKYQVSNEKPSVEEYSYSWEEQAVEVGEIIRENGNAMYLEPHTAYRFYIDPSTLSYYNRDTHNIFDARLSGWPHGAVIKDFFVHYQYRSYADLLGFGVVVYNHSDRRLLFWLGSYVEILVFINSDYDSIWN